MTPCLQALKGSHPDIKIAVLSEPLAATLLEDHPLVDQLIIVRQSTSSRARAITRLRKQRFDIAFNLHGGSTGAIFARLSGARRSVGYRGLPLSWTLSDRAPSPDVILGRTRIHSVEQQLALLKWAGLSWPALRPQTNLVVSPEARAKLREKLRALSVANRNEAGRFGCIVPGAAFESKRWSAEGFAAVVDHLSARWGMGSVVIAGPGQEDLANRVVSAANARPAVLGGLNLKELVALLEIARIFVGNDSGPTHIAAALNCPVVAVWGSSDPTVWHPWTETPFRVVEAAVAERQGPRRQDDAQKPEPELSTIKLVTKRDVIAAVDEVLESALEANYSVNRLR